MAPHSPSIAPESAEPQLLNEANLALLTKRHPANARTTVAFFLKAQLGRTFSTVILPNTITPARTAPPPRPSPGPSSSRHNNPPDTALVLHDDSEGPKAQEGATEAPQERGRENEGKRKVSLVAAMRPRAASRTSQAAASAGPSKVVGSERRKVQGREGRADGAGTSSSLLVARADVLKEVSPRREVESHKDGGSHGKEQVEEEERPIAKENQDPSPKKEKGKRRAVEEAPKAQTKGKKKDDDFSSDEEEHAARLEARRLRRAAKALIVKDRTQSAAAKGATAASKLKASTSRSKKKKRKEKAEAEGGDESEPSDDDREWTRKKRKASTAETNKILQSAKKPSNVTGSRLTMRPMIKLGLFHKGAASTRTKIGQKLPDLAFSELNFLNATRPSPPPPPASHSSSSSHSSSPSSNSESSSSSEAAPEKYGRKRRAPDHKVVVFTYGKTKKKVTKRESKYFDKEPSIDSPPPRAPPPASKPSHKLSKAPVAAPPESHRSSRHLPKASPPPEKRRTSQPVRKAPSPPASELASLSRPSEHSAYSLAHAHAKKKQKRSSSPHLDLDPDPNPAPSAIRDTSHAWPTFFPPPRGLSPASSCFLLAMIPGSRGSPSPSPSPPPPDAPASLSELDRLIQACFHEPLPDENDGPPPPPRRLHVVPEAVRPPSRYEDGRPRSQYEVDDFAGGANGELSGEQYWEPNNNGPVRSSTFVGDVVNDDDDAGADEGFVPAEEYGWKGGRDDGFVELDRGRSFDIFDGEEDGDMSVAPSLFEQRDTGSAEWEWRQPATQGGGRGRRVGAGRGGTEWKEVEGVGEDRETYGRRESIDYDDDEEDRREPPPTTSRAPYPFAFEFNPLTASRLHQLGPDPAGGGSGGGGAGETGRGFDSASFWYRSKP